MLLFPLLFMAATVLSLLVPHALDALVLSLSIFSDITSLLRGEFKALPGVSSMAPPYRYYSDVEMNDSDTDSEDSGSESDTEPDGEWGSYAVPPLADQFEATRLRFEIHLPVTVDWLGEDLDDDTERAILRIALELVDSSGLSYHQNLDFDFTKPWSQSKCGGSHSKCGGSHCGDDSCDHDHSCGDSCGGGCSFKRKFFWFMAVPSRTMGNFSLPSVMLLVKHKRDMVTDEGTVVDSAGARAVALGMAASIALLSI